MRHIGARELWLQEEVRKGKVMVKKVPGNQNPADLMTKHLGAREMEEHCESLKVEQWSGRAAKASEVSRSVEWSGCSELP